MTKIAQFHLEYFSNQIMTTIRQIQNFRKKSMAFTYNHWIKYKSEMRYLICTVTELSQNGKMIEIAIPKAMIKHIE